MKKIFFKLAVSVLFMAEFASAQAVMSAGKFQGRTQAGVRCGIEIIDAQSSINESVTVGANSPKNANLSMTVQAAPSYRGKVFPTIDMENETQLGQGYPDYLTGYKVWRVKGILWDTRTDYILKMYFDTNTLIPTDYSLTISGRSDPIQCFDLLPI